MAAVLVALALVGCATRDSAAVVPASSATAAPASPPVSPVAPPVAATPRRPGAGAPTPGAPPPTAAPATSATANVAVPTSPTANIGAQVEAPASANTPTAGVAVPTSPTAGVAASTSPPAGVAVPTSPPASVTVPTSPTSAVADRPADELARVLANEPPQRDVYDLARRFRTGGTPPAVPTPAATEVAGSSREFWVPDGQQKRYFRVRAQLLRQTRHADFYVQEGQSVDEAGVDRSLRTFEETIVPRLLGEFGGGRAVLDDRPVAILNVRLRGLVGYYSSVDEYPRSVFPYSNERPLIGMSLESVRPGTRGYDSGLAHEFEHLIQWRLDPAEATWVNEGTAELAIRAVGLDPSSNYQAFLREPSTQLTDWAEQPGATLAHYGAADLFFAYVAQRFGGFGVIGEILARRERGIAGIEPVLRAHAGVEAGSFDRVFLDWQIANWANQPSASDGRYGHRQLPQARAQAETLAAIPTRVRSDASQYGGRYFELPAAAAGGTIEISAPAEVPLVAAPERPGAVWWSGRADSADSRLTRAVDLTGVSRATLRFSAWFDLERDYDYAYVAVSRNGGASWQALAGRHTSAADPTGNSYGAGYTGRSGGDGAWVDEEIDLGPFAGQAILLRFETITDDAYNADGFCVDAIEIPEIGWRDRDDDPGWQSQGFTRIRNRVPQRLTVSLIAIAGDEVRVTTASAGADGRVTLRLPADLRDATRRAVLVTPHTPITRRPASFELAVAPP